MNSFRKIIRTLALSTAFLLSSCLHREVDSAVAADIHTVTALKAKYGFPELTKGPDSLTLKSSYSELTFKKDSRLMHFNGTLVWMNDGLLKKEKDYTLSSKDINLVVTPLLTSRKILKNSRVSVVVLDPGHGGSDTGAIGKRKLYEKKAVLDIAKKVKQSIAGSNIRVFLTRDSDRDLSLSARSALARNWKADLFVSIHLNSAGNLNAEGVETYVMSNAGSTSTASNKPDKKSYEGNRYDSRNMILAYNLQKETLSTTSAPDRGIKKARFEVLRNAPCPAVLIECGFVSNRKEEAKLLTSTYRQKIADGIANGLKSYKAIADSK